MEAILSNKNIPRQRQARPDELKVLERLVNVQASNRISAADTRAFAILTPFTWFPLTTVFLSTFNLWPTFKPWEGELGSTHMYSGIVAYVSIAPIFGAFAGALWLAVHLYHKQRILAEDLGPLKSTDAAWVDSFWVVDEPEQGILGCFHLDDISPPLSKDSPNEQKFVISYIGLSPDAPSFGADFALFARILANCKKLADEASSISSTSAPFSVQLKLYPVLDKGLTKLARKLQFVPQFSSKQKAPDPLHMPFQSSSFSWLDQYWPVNLESRTFEYRSDRS